MQHHRPLPRRLQKQLIEDEAEVGVATAGVHHHRVAEAGKDVFERWPQKPDQVVDLLQLPQRIGVEVAVAGEQVKLLQQLGALLGEQLPPHLWCFDLPPQTGMTSTTSGTASRRRFSMPIFSVMVELGQPLQEPCMCR